MKFYFLKLARHGDQESNTIGLEQDLDTGRWITPVIDLYDNDSYTNYSLTKSDYGHVLSQSTTWIGLQESGSSSFFDTEFLLDPDTELTTSSGLLKFSDSATPFMRFIDTTGRIDLVSMRVASDHNPEIILYNHDTNDDEFYTEEWERRPSDGHFNESNEFAVIGSGRYLIVSFDFGDSSPADFEAYLRVEIDRTIMAPLYRHTRVIGDKFPEWMALHNLPEEGATPELATPNSVGMGLINALAGEWLDDISRKLNYRDFQKYIGTIDLNQLAWDYETIDIPDVEIYSVKGDGIELARSHDYEEYVSLTGEHACFIDVEENVIYSIQEYDTFTINDEEFIQSPHHVWNYLDEIGMLVDLERLPNEGNESYQTRIRDVFINRGGVGVESFKNALRRELNLWKYEGSTPDSNYVGATPTVLEFEDLQQDSKYFDPDGMPTDAFIRLVEKISREYPTTWGRFVWNRALWDISGGEDHPGYGIIPRRYDTSLPESESRIQSGVGDGNDLFVFRPDVITGPRDFSATLQLRGRRRTIRQEYRPVEFEIEVSGHGTVDEVQNPTKQVWLTVELEIGGATPGTAYFSFEHESTSDAETGATPSPATESTFEIFDEVEPTTDQTIEFRDMATNELWENTGIVDVEDITTVTLKQGRWDGDASTPSYVDIESEDHFEVWFGHDDTDVLAFDVASISYGVTADATPFLPTSSVVMISLLTEPPVPVEHHFDLNTYDVVVNGRDPYVDPESVTIDLHEINWDEDAYDRSVKVQITTTNPFNEAADEFGALTPDQDNDYWFVPADDIVMTPFEGGATPVESSTPAANWVDGVVLLNEETTALEFEVSSSTVENETESISYPIDTYTWVPFEAEHDTPLQGIVDENGPWRNGVAPKVGSSNFTLEVYENLTRDDFGIPHSDEWMVTWIGVTSDNSRAIVWLDTNTVKPHEPDDNTSYPDNAVEEEIVDSDDATPTDVYSYSSVVVRARLKPDPSPEWYPQVHSGYFYDRGDEYYFYAKPKTESTSTDELILSEVARQGAPIIAWTDEATPRELKQTAFYELEGATPEFATPVLTHIATEELEGNGTEILYVAYRDLYDVTAYDEDSTPITVIDTATPGQIGLAEVTQSDSTYTVKYRVLNSFFADNDFVDDDGKHRTRISFDATPSGFNYEVTYETSEYDPATPVGVPLNTMHTIQNEGFLYISFNEYTLESIRVHLSPNKILADGVDYIMVTLQSLDEHGNPKPNVNFELSTDFGTLEETSITTDQDGFSVINLNSDDVFTTSTGTLTITGDVSTEIEFEIQDAAAPEPFLLAAPRVGQIQADGESENLVYGRLFNADFSPMGAGVEISWKRARSIYELFFDDPATPTYFDSGTVTTDEEGSFEVGPFLTQDFEDAGYWFVSLEATVNTDEATPSATPETVTIGDVVFWYEYHEAMKGVENADGIPRLPAQMSFDADSNPKYYNHFVQSYPYNEEGSLEESTPSINWLPPEWYAIPQFLQWEMGIKTHKSYKNI